MDISIFGLGYVGSVTAGCLAALGHRVTGVDTDSFKADMLGNGLSPVIEPGLPELLQEAKSTGLLKAAHQAEEAIESTELSMICVGTPSKPNGSLSTEYVEQVSETIGKCLRSKKEPHMLVFRSTLLPGTVRNILIPLLEKFSGMKNSKDFFTVYNPEFLRESTAVKDFMNPALTVTGSDSEAALNKASAIYEKLPGNIIKTNIETAEMLKYVCNAFHALKITFSNEVGVICKNLGLDSRDVMKIFKQETQLNISPAYLNPGFAFGGSCLPKDLRAINYFTKINDLETPLLDSLLKSNHIQIVNAAQRILSLGKRKIGIAGFSFKGGTDDLRESPVIELAEILLGKGCDLKLYDRNVSKARSNGINEDYLQNHIPHIIPLIVESIGILLEDRDIIIIGTGEEEFKRIPEAARKGQMVFDLTGVCDRKRAVADYTNVCDRKPAVADNTNVCDRKPAVADCTNVPAGGDYSGENYRGADYEGIYW